MPNKLSYKFPAPAGWFFLLLLGGCQSISLAEPQGPSRSIMIPVFQNGSFEPGLEGKLTRSVKEEFLTRPGYRIVQDRGRADMVLEGRVDSMGLDPLSFDRLHRTAEYRVTVTADFKLVQGRDRSTLWQQVGMSGSAEFNVSPDPAVNRSVQDLAIGEALKRLAEQVWVEVARMAASQPPDQPPPVPNGETSPSLPNATDEREEQEHRSP